MQHRETRRNTMQNGNEEILDGQQGDIGAEGQSPSEPVDLNEAFRMLRQGNKAPAPKPVEVDEAGSGDSGESDTGAGEGFENPADVQPGFSGDNGASGGDSDGLEGVDWSARRESLRNQVAREAIARSREFIESKGYKKWTIRDDIQQRDERSGTVRYINPENGREFTGGRQEAENWVNSMNKEFDEVHQQEARRIFQQNMELYRPVDELMEFAPKFERMSENVRDVFEDLIEDYAILDANGDPIGYRCNLDAMAQRAARIAEKYSKAPEPAEPSKEDKANDVRRPSMKTPSSSGASGAQKDPNDFTDISDAMKYLNSKKRENSRK